MPQRGISPQPRANSPRLYITQSPSSEGGLQSHTYFLSSSILSTRTSLSETVKFACMKITDGLLSSFLRSSFRGRLIFLLFPGLLALGWDKLPLRGKKHYFLPTIDTEDPKRRVIKRNGIKALFLN